MNLSRRNFIRTAGSAAAMIPAAGIASTIYPSGAKTAVRFKLAVAGYTFAKFPFEKSLEMMKTTGMSLLGVKDFHVPLSSTPEQVSQALAKMKSYGVEPYGVGPIYMKSKEAVDQAFAYAKLFGVKLIIGVPDVEFLPYVDKKVKEYDYRLAIHNHGPDLPIYPSAEDIWKEIKDLDPRIGFCLDIAHTARLGLDPIETYIKYRERIFDFHVWDVDKPEKAGWCVEAGRGIIDFPKFFSALIKYNYTGTCSLEYGKNMDDPLSGIAESIGYFKGVIAAL